jgi:hypothetical protein
LARGAASKINKIRLVGQRLTLSMHARVSQVYMYPVKRVGIRE